jgi:phage-related protein
MVSASKELKIKYTADTSGVKKGVGEIDKLNSSLSSKLKSAGASMTSVGKSATLGLTLPIVAFGASAVASFSEAQAAANQTAAVLKSTGGAAGVTESNIARLSSTIGKLSAQDNDAVRAGENMLLTFTNIRNEAGKGNDIFNQASMTLADLSAAMGTDSKTSAIQLGKALNDPTKGLSALSRVGVTFTEQQAKQVAAMQKSGNVAGAQKLILGELNKEFGGSAKAAGDAASPMVKIGLVMDDLGESVGAILVPMLQGLVEWVQKAADWFNKLSPGAKEIAVKIALVAAAIGPLLIVGGKMVSAIGSIAKGFSALTTLLSANPWILLALALVAVAVLIYKNWDKIKGFIMPILNAIKTVALAVWDAIKTAAAAVWSAIGGFVMAAWAIIKQIAGLYFRVWAAIFKAVWEVVKVVWKAISGAVKIAWAIISGIAKAYVAAWKVVFKVVWAVAKVVWKAISGVVKVAWRIISGIVKAYIAAWKVVFRAVWAAAKVAWNAISTVVRVAWGVLKGIGHGIVSFFKGVWNGIHDAAKNVWDGIKSIVSGAWDSIVSFGTGAVNNLIKLLNSVIHGVNTVIGGFNRLPGPDIGTIPDIPYLAHGGNIVRAGLAIVGERGPELAAFPAGASVTPLGRGGGLAGDLDVTLTLDRRRFGRGLELETMTRGR